MWTLRPLVLFLAIVAAGGFPAAGAQAPAQLAGHFEGAILILGTELAIQVEFQAGDQGLAATIDIPQQGAAGLALANVRFDPPTVHFELPAGPGVAIFDGELRGEEIAGKFLQAGMAGEFRLARRAASALPQAAPEPLPYREEEVTFVTADGTFAGTLTLPPGPGRHPAVVLLTGSGAQNRDEELFGFKPFRLIADHLTRNGITVLRYDDRGIGGTTASAAQATSAEFASDALAAVAYLKARPEIDAQRVGLLGHSEGGLVGPLAATRSRDVALLVLISGPGVPGEQILLEQAAAIGRAQGANAADLEREAGFQRRAFAAVRSGSDPVTIRAEVSSLAREQLARLPEEQRQAIGGSDQVVETAIEAQVRMLQSPWFRFFLDYDPAPTLEKVRCPVLALFGEKDLQVPAETNRKAVAEALARGGNADVTTMILPGANHLFQAAALGTPNEYAALKKEFVPGFLETISRWIRSRTGLTGS